MMKSFDFETNSLNLYQMKYSKNRGKNMHVEKKKSPMYNKYEIYCTYRRELEKCRNTGVREDNITCTCNRRLALILFIERSR